MEAWVLPVASEFAFFVADAIKVVRIHKRRQEKEVSEDPNSSDETTLKSSITNSPKHDGSLTNFLDFNTIPSLRYQKVLSDSEIKKSEAEAIILENNKENIAPIKVQHLPQSNKPKSPKSEKILLESTVMMPDDKTRIEAVINRLLSSGENCKVCYRRYPLYDPRKNDQCKYCVSRNHCWRCDKLLTLSQTDILKYLSEDDRYNQRFSCGWCSQTCCYCDKWIGNLNYRLTSFQLHSHHEIRSCDSCQKVNFHEENREPNN